MGWFSKSTSRECMGHGLKNPYESLQAAPAHYRAMESNAGVVFFIMLALSVVGWWLLEPAPLFPLACLVGGALAFLSNRKSAEGKTGFAFAFAVIGIFLGVLFIPSALGKSEILLITGTHFGLSFFGLITIRKLLLAHRTDRRT